MGKPVKIKELAEKMIRLSGLKLKDKFHPNGDIEIKYTGLRAGEKLYEELLIGDNVSETDNPLIMRAKEEKINWDDLKPLLGKLSEANDNLDYTVIRKILIKIVPGFEPQNEISDILYKNKTELN
jgi:FlaA1/EpsC-like NDP-sugar epimerase